MDDPFDLMDRLEYWVVQKDIAKDAGLLDQVCFSISNEGYLFYCTIVVALLTDLKSLLNYYYFFKGRLP